MAAELSIQSVEDLSKAFGKLSRAVSGVKSALGTVKGTNALQELQKVVAGVDRLEAALNTIERGVGMALSKIVAKIDELPRGIADALAAGGAATRRAGKQLTDSLGEGLVEGVKSTSAKFKSAWAKEKDEQQKLYEAALKAGNSIRDEELRQMQLFGVQMVKIDRERLQELALQGKQQITLDNELTASMARAQAQRITEIKAGKALELQARKEAAEKAAAAEAYFARVTGQSKLSGGSAQDSASAIDTELAAREKAATAVTLQELNKRVAAAKAAEVERVAAEASGAKASQDLRIQDINRQIKAAKEASAARLAEETASERASQALRLQGLNQRVQAAKAAYAQEVADAKEAAKKIEAVQMSAARAQVNQAMTKGAASNYSVYAPTSKEHGMLKTFNEELGETEKKAGAVSKAFKGLTIDGNDTHSAMRGLASGFNLLWLTWGNLVPLLAGAAISNGFAQTVKMGLEVGQTFSVIRVLSEETAESVGKLQDQMLSLATNGPFGLRQIAEAMKTLSLAGLSAGEVGASIKDVLSFAVAGDTSLKQSADTLTSVAKAFKYSADQYNIVADVIAKTAAVSKSSVENMSEAFKVASVINSQYGASLEDVGVGLAALSNLGITGSAAGTALRNMYADLSGRSKEVVKILKGLKIEFRDVDTGKFPDLVTLMGRFQDAVNKAGTAVQKQDLINKLLSERGAKPVIEMMQQIGTEAEMLDGRMTNLLAELQKKIAQRAGFVAIANAELSTTASKQIEATFSDLQAAAYKAFSSIEPSIFRVTAALRNAFESESFQTALKGIMEMTASVIEIFAKLTSVVLEHAEAAKNLLLVYVGFKILGGLGGTLVNMGTSLTALTASMAASGGVATTLRTSLTGLSATFGALFGAKSLMDAATALSGVFAVLGRGLALLGPIAAALTLAYTAWQLYTEYANKAADANARHSGKQSDELVGALQRELQAITDKNEALKLGISLEQYKGIVEEQHTRSNKNEAVEVTQKALAEAQKAYNLQLEASKKVSYDAYNAGAKLLSGKEAELSAAKRAAAAAVAERENFESKTASLKKAIVVANEYNATLVAQDRAIADSNRRAKDKNSLTGEYDPDAAAKNAAAAADKTLQDIQKNYKQELAITKSQYDSELRLLDDKHSKKLLSEGQYNILYLSKVEESERAQIDIAKKYDNLEIKAAAEQRARLAKALEGKPKAGVSLTNFDKAVATQGGSIGKDIEGIETQALERQAKAANSAAAAMNDLQRASADYWAKDKARLEQESSAKRLSEDLENATEAQKHYAAAFETAYKAYTPQIEKQAAALANVNKEVEDIVNLMTDGPVSIFDGFVSPAALEMLSLAGQKTQFLTADVDKLREAAQKAGELAGQESAISKFLSGSAGEDAARGYDKASKAIAGLVTAMEKLAKVQKEAANDLAYADAKRAQALLDGADATKTNAQYEKERAAITAKSQQLEIRQYGNIASAAKNFFKQGTTGYKLLDTAEKGFRAYELAMSLKSVGIKAAEWLSKVTITEAGEAALTGEAAAGEAARNLLKIPGVFLTFMSQLGPWGIAAAAAAIAALGLAAAGSHSSGSVTKPNDGTGTVFGDVADSNGNFSQKSKSIENSIDNLSQNSDIALTYSQGMLSALKNIEANIGGLTNLIVRSTNGNLTSGANLAQSGTSLPSWLTDPASGVLFKLSNSIPILGKLSNALFGTKVNVTGTGLSLSGQTLGSVKDSGANLQQYADTHTSKKFFGITYSQSNGTTYAAADKELADQFTKVLKGFYDAVKLAAVPLGENLNDVSVRLNQFVVDIGKIDLQGLTGEQIQERLTAVLGATADNIAKSAIPGLEAFQKVGEGYFETTVRVASSIEVAQYTLEKLGVSMVKYTDVLNKQGDVALELVRDSILKAETLSTVTTISKIPKPVDRMKALMAGGESLLDGEGLKEFHDAFVNSFSTITTITPVLTGIGKIIQTFSGTSDELAQLYTSLVGIRKQFKDVGLGAVDFGIDMIRAAGGIDQLKDGLSSYYDNFLTDQERIAAMTANLSTEFGKIGVAMPTSIQGFKDLVKGIDLTSDAGQVTFGKVIVLADSFYKLQDALGSTATTVNKVAEERTNLEGQLATAQQAYNEATMTSAQLLALQRAGIDASNQALFDQIQALKESTAAAVKAAAERKDLQSQLNDLTLSDTQKLQMQRDALEASNQALFDQVQAAKAAKAAETELANTRKAIADEIANLQTQYDDLTLTDAEKALKERSKLLSDEARTIFDNIQAVKTQLAAEQALAEQRKAASDELANLKNQYDDLTLTDAQKLLKERTALLSDEARTMFDNIQAAKALQAAEQALAEHRKAIADELANLQGQYDDLTLTDAQKLLKERASLLSDEARSMFDNIQAVKAQQAAEQALAEQRKAITDELANLQGQYDDLTLTDAQKLLKERASLLSDEARSMFDNIQAVKAQQAAEQALADQRRAISDELANLQGQYDDIALTEAQKLAKQRTALLSDDARAMFDNIQALKAQQAAEQSLADQRRAIADEIANLQGQYDDLTLTDAQKAAKAREALLSDDAKAIFDNIQAVKAQQLAAEQAAQAAEQAAQAAQALREAWQSVADGILEEINRIKGNLGSPQQNLAQAQTAFSIATAQTMAGDAEAGKTLPQLSKNLLDIAANTSKSTLEYNNIQASTLASLDRTLRYIAQSQGASIPAFAAGGDHMGGFRIVGENGPELEATGASRIYNAAQTKAMLDGQPTYEELLAEMRELKQLMRQLVEDQRAIGGAEVSNTNRIAKVLDRVTPDRDSIQVKVVT